MRAMTGMLVAAVLGLGTLMTSCSDNSSPSDTGPAGATYDWVAGDYPPQLTQQKYLEIDGVDGQQGLTREYKVHVPASYNPAVPTPLVFCLHGLLQDPVMFCVKGASYVDKSDAEGFILVMPNGYQRSWNGGSCCGQAASMKLDDVALIRAIFAEVSRHLNVDRDRVYATGLSNGGFLSYRLACEAADLFAAVAPGAGGVGTDAIAGDSGTTTSDMSDCKPSRPISLFDAHGTADPLVPYAVQQPSTDLIASSNGCSLATEPAAQPLSAGDTTCVSYKGCPSGIAVTRCTVEQGGHCWFGSSSCGTGGPLAGAIGNLIVGNNSDTLRNTDDGWTFLAGKSR